MGADLTRLVRNARRTCMCTSANAGAGGATGTRSKLFVTSVSQSAQPPRATASGRTNTNTVTRTEHNVTSAHARAEVTWLSVRRQLAHASLTVTWTALMASDVDVLKSRSFSLMRIFLRPTDWSTEEWILPLVTFFRIFS